MPTCSNQTHSVTLSPSMLPSSPTSVCECSSQKIITRTVSLSPFFALKCAVLFDVMFCSYPLHCSGKILLITKEVPFYFVCPFSTVSSYGQGKIFHTYCLDNYLTLQRVEPNTQTAQLPCLPCRLSSCIQKPSSTSALLCLFVIPRLKQKSKNPWVKCMQLFKTRLD